MLPRSRRRIEQSGIPVPGESEEDGPVGRQPQGPQEAQGRGEVQKIREGGAGAQTRRRGGAQQNGRYLNKISQGRAQRNIQLAR